MPLHLSEVDRVLISQSFENTSTPPCPSKTLMPGSWTPEPVGGAPAIPSREVRCEKQRAAQCLRTCRARSVEVTGHTAHT